MNMALRHKYAAASSGARPAGMPARGSRPSRRASVAAAAAGGSAGSASGGAAGAAATRRLFLGAGAAAAGLVSVPMAARAREERVGEVRHTDTEWLEILGRDRYNILRNAGTEFPLTSELNNEKRKV
uniref:MsrB domain-containing protein n=1 Tax=Chlamydomonas euryale TaxID=1486919 RepID=A0A7R9Z0G0_9CHLO|mmetsp:Transcript_37184/g.109695  ORF Transcript_37184/g.109695 Transcript_37184/m.109695 type:complete len:127 (+) Transcript_37184:224-604(+)